MKLRGTCSIGKWVSSRYIKQYGIWTPFVMQFHAQKVYIQTDKGLWRPGSKGYCYSALDAGKYEFSDAVRTIIPLGREKKARLILA